MKSYSFKVLSVTFVCALILTGCATTRNLLGKDYTKETVPNRKTYFTKVWAVEEDGHFKVTGRLRARGNTHANIPKFVKVTILDSDGAVIEKEKVAYTPRVLTRSRRHRGARFTAYFSASPPPGAIIRLSNVN